MKSALILLTFVMLVPSENLYSEEVYEEANYGRSHRRDRNRKRTQNTTPARSKNRGKNRGRSHQQKDPNRGRSGQSQSQRDYGQGGSSRRVEGRRVSNRNKGVVVSGRTIKHNGRRHTERRRNGVVTVRKKNGMVYRRYPNGKTVRVRTHIRHNRPYSYSTHIPYRHSYRHKRSYARPIHYHYTVPLADVYLRNWIRAWVGFNIYSAGVHLIGGYPYYIENGYRYRYSSYDRCDYELIDSHGNWVQFNFYGTCSVSYDQCAYRRDSLNYSWRQYRYFCAERYYRDSNYYYDDNWETRNWDMYLDSDGYFEFSYRGEF